MKLDSDIQKSKYRSDIDGLRALSVLAVVLFHAFPDWVGGGFIGVDVFFVISGYLITPIIFESLDKGVFRFINFYARRIRRIFPALILVLATSFGVGWFVLLPGEFAQLGKHIIGAASFTSNLILWDEVGYFDNSADTKPLLHLWSLAIEEQFYIIWPFLIWLAWKRNLNYLTILIFLIVCSFFLNSQGVQHNQSGTFYSLHTRVWELLCGALIACATLYYPDLCTRVKDRVNLAIIFLLYRNRPSEPRNNVLLDSISFFGLMLLLWGFCYLNKNVRYPGFWALVPVLGAIGLITAGSHAWVNRVILSNKIMVWIGLISFPLYLWHWPLLTFARIIEGEVPEAKFRIIAIAIATVLSWATFYFIERPIRAYGEKKSVIVLVLLLATIGFLGYNTFERGGLAFRNKEFDVKNARLLSQLGIPPNHQLRNATCETRFPDFHDGLCVLNQSRDPDILLVGDSHALQYYSGLSKILTSKNIGMLGAGWARRYGEPLNPLIGAYANDSQSNYSRQRAIYHAIENNPNISTVIIACSPHYCDDLNFERNLDETFRILTGLKKEIYYVLPIPPLPFDPKLCLDVRPLRLTPKLDTPCAYRYADYLDATRSYRAKVLRAVAQYPNVKIFDPSRAMCDERWCYAIKDGKLLYRNDGENAHLSDDGSLFVAPLFARLLEGS